MTSVSLREAPTLDQLRRCEYPVAGRGGRSGAKPALPPIFQKSQAGGTGLTFLSKNSGFPWVVKWQNPKNATLERICTEFYERSFRLLSIPKIFHRSEVALDLVNQLMQYCASIATSMHSDHTPLLISKEKGNTFSDAYKNGNLCNLHPEALLELARVMGEVAGYDLLVGNTDRVAMARFNGHIVSAHTINGGNFLIEAALPAPGQERAPGRIAKIHFIDNCPNAQLLFSAQERRLPEEEGPNGLEEGGIGGLFGETGSQSNSQVFVRSPIEQDNGEELRASCREDFMYFATASTEQLELLARQILIGLKNEVKAAVKDPSHFLGETWADEPTFLAHIVQGLVHSQQELRANVSVLSNVAEELKRRAQELDCSELALIALDFIIGNLDSLEKSRERNNASEKVGDVK